MKNDTKIRCSRSLLLKGFQRKEKNEEWYKKSGVTDPGLVWYCRPLNTYRAEQLKSPLIMYHPLYILYYAPPPLLQII